jgi:riboflavin biosynthesis pyrimidine reductase
MPTDSLLEPFDVLYEAEGLPATALPAGLSHVYGGDFGLDEPRVYANFVSTLDGTVAIPSIPRSNDLINGGNEADRFLMGLLRAFADVVLVGSGTLRASPQGTWRPDKVYPPAAEAFADLRRSLGRRPAAQVAVLTGSGSIDPRHPVLSSGALVLTSEPGAARLAGALPAEAEVVTLGAETRIDGGLVVAELHKRGHRLILSEAGPHTFGSLVAAKVVDELFLTVSPLLTGDAGPGSRLRLVEAADLIPPVDARPLSFRRHGAHLFSRYELNALAP